MFKSLTKPIVTLQGILDGITKKLGEMHSVAGMIFQEQSLEAYEELAATTKMQGEETRSFIKDTMFKSSRDITDLKDAVLKALANEEKERIQKEFEDNVKWLDSLSDISFELNSNRAKRQKGTCGWIFEEDGYKQWVAPEEPAALLWIYGNAGFGKSVLMGAIIDKLLENITAAPSNPGDSGPSTFLAFFFCKVGNEKTQETQYVIRSLVSQYYHYCKQSMPQETLAEANALIKTKIVRDAGNAAAGLPSFASQDINLKSLLIDMIKLVNKTSYIVVDGM